LEGEVLIQKRVADKETFPGLWDISVAGHIGAGERPLLAARRELFEEIGLKLKEEELLQIGSYRSDCMHSEFLIDREYHHVYIAKLDTELENLKLQKEEVAEIKLISIVELKNEISLEKKTLEFVPYSTAYFKMTFEAIETQITNFNTNN
jgi:isopentenyldiphosphate isomerase